MAAARAAQRPRNRRHVPASCERRDRGSDRALITGERAQGRTDLLDQRVRIRPHLSDQTLRHPIIEPERNVEQPDRKGTTVGEGDGDIQSLS